MARRDRRAGDRRRLGRPAQDTRPATPGAAKDQAGQQPGAAKPGDRAIGQPDGGDPALRREFQGLLAEVNGAYRRYLAELAKLKDDDQKKAYNAANWPVEKVVAGPMLDLARRHPEDPSAFDALAWLAIIGYNTPQEDEAAEMLARHYAADRRLWLITQEMRRGVLSTGRGTLLRAVLEKNPDRTTRGRACLDLAGYQADLAEFVRILATPGMMPWQAQAYTAERLDRFRALDPGRLDQDAERLYGRVLEEYADVVPVRWWTMPRMTDADPRTIYTPTRDGEADTGTLADRARSALVELRTLSVGKVAPEIVGRDVDNRPLKLGDYRGRVVVLTFSGTWCGPCKSMYPHQREIVARLKARPFALVSVMTDEDAGAIRKEIASGEITWPCWWEKGGTHGAIPTAWNVNGYPTVYILDHKGVIRLKFTGYLGSPRGPAETIQPPIDEFLDRLLREQADAARATAPGGEGRGARG